MTGILNLLLGAGGVIKDTYFNLVSLLLPGNGTNGAQNNTFLDSSTNNFTITRNGNTTQGTFSPFSQTGWGNYFDGTGDSLSVASNAAFAFGTGDFTISTWIYPTSVSGVQVVIDCRLAGPSTGVAVFLNGTTISCARDGVNVVLSGGTVTTNQWQFVEVTRTSGDWRIFLNGTSVAGPTTNTTNFSSNSPVVIGDSVAGSQVFNGYMSNVRILKGTGGTTSTVPTAPLTAIANTSLLTCQSNRFIDNSSNNFTITRNGDTRVVAFSPFAPTAAYTTAAVGGSGYFDGTGDYLTWGPGSGAAFGTSAFCVEMWFYPTGSIASAYLIDARNASQTNTWSFAFGYSGTSSRIEWANNGTVIANGGTTNIISNAWNHIVYCRSGTGANQASMFINGVRQANITDSTNYSTSPTTSYIGARFSAADFVTGYLSSIRIVNGSQVYDPSLSTLTVPTAPLTAITNTSTLLNYTNAGITDATAKNDLETVGNAQISTSVSKFGGGSVAFDGTSTTGLTIPNSSLLTFGSGDWSIEFWIYRVGNSTTQGVFDQRTAAATEIRPLIYINASNQIVYYTNAVDRITASLSQNTWVYVAVVKSSGVTRMYIDGTVQATTYTDTNTYLAPTNQTRIGRLIDGFPFNGYIDDFRITLGRARTTTASPTAPFPLQ